MQGLMKLLKLLGEGLGEEGLERALEQLKEKGPLWAVVLSVAFSIAAFIKDFMEGKKEDIVFDFVTIGARTAVFCAIFVLAFALAGRRKRRFKVLEEVNQYELEAQEDGKTKAICRQTLAIQARINDVTRYSADQPLSGGVLASFEAPMRRLAGDAPKGYTGVGVPLSYPLKRGETEKLLLRWEYESRQIPDEIKTILRVPVDLLKIMVILPPGKPKPTKCGWYQEDIIEPQPVGKGGEIAPQPYGEDRFSLSKEFQKAVGRLDYVIWWQA